MPRPVLILTLLLCAVASLTAAGAIHATAAPDSAVPNQTLPCNPTADRVLDPYSGTQEKMVFCNYSQSSYYILVKRPNNRVQSAGKQDVS